LQTVTRPAGGIAQSLVSGSGHNGWASGPDSGYSNAGYVETAPATIATSLPRFQGIAFTSDGATYVTTDTPSITTSYKVDGIFVRNDGAVHGTTTAGAGTTKLNGLTITTIGQLVMSSAGDPHVGLDILMESGSYLLLEDGTSTILLES
jgi:hypothetical protein